eukprot:CAMPEP_0181327250 /NCGR_PEP_ID=MMETSP1101-20121128/21988_1 /TAXON_ID=46948 /ORGANISM="Rhodomonas abbreviata, Strain Caron Lab Isolate" /LENGTH=205 /DNA_ID=CAMNT_0023435871 /DNA_START=603 /DNA_END=1220 /DNA_ORIENTATION=-
MTWEARTKQYKQQHPWKGGAYQIVNANAAHLGWYHFSKSSGEQDRNVEKIRSFIEYLNATMDQVLITEDLLRGLVLFHHNTNLSLSEVVPRSFKVRKPTTELLRGVISTTQHKPRKYTLPTNSQLATVLDLALVDRMLYAFFVEKHRKTWEDTVIHQPVVLQKLQKLQCMQKAVANATDLPEYWDMDSEEFLKMLQKKEREWGIV